MGVKKRNDEQKKDAEETAVKTALSFVCDFPFSMILCLSPGIRKARCVGSSCPPLGFTTRLVTGNDLSLVTGNE